MQSHKFTLEWRTRFEALERERDKLAAELHQTYPKVVSQLVDLFARIRANDAALSQLHQSRPSNAKGYLKGAELTARGLEDFTRDTLSLVARDRLQLPLLFWASAGASNQSPSAAQPSRGRPPNLPKSVT